MEFLSFLFVMKVFVFQVCFKDVMFPLLPRMRGGLYYNSYVVSAELVVCMYICMYVYMSVCM